uniref:Retrotransposon gag domain-containing protein n=1 Tax=Fagus sylvatica TaxID=28930 RepID=A0A2N9HIL8_FAGSY
MMGETSGPSAQDIRMASFEEKFNDLLNFVRLLVKRDTEIDPNVARPRMTHLQKGIGTPLKALSLLQMYGNGEENVMNKKEDDHSDIRSLQGQPLYPSNQGDTIEPHSDVDGHSSKGSKESEKEAQSPISKKEEPKEVDHPMIPHKRLISPVFLKQSPHLLHDSSKKCEFHFGRPGHSLEDCHALKNKVQDLVDHGILRINEGSTPSVIIAWPPEHCKDETVIPSPQSQRPTTCGIQPVHLTMLPTLSEDKVEYRTSRCMTLKRKIQGLGHSEPDVPFMVQARKPSMHTVPMKKARSTLGFGANGPSRDQTERTIPRSTGAWIPHRQG